MVCFSPEHGNPITWTDCENGVVGGGQTMCGPSAIGVTPRLHPDQDSAGGASRILREEHLGSINRVGESVDTMAMGNGRCLLPRQPHSPSRKADEGLKIPETDVFLPPG